MSWTLSRCRYAFVVFAFTLVASAVHAETASKGNAPQSTAPFVIPHERFGVHDEIPKSLSGQLLLTELSCTACHATTAKSEKASTKQSKSITSPSQPEFVWQPKRAPKLDGVSLRLNSSWIAEFLQNPHRVKPGTTMPSVFFGVDNETKQEEIDALIAFLSTQQADFPAIRGTGLYPVPFEFWKLGDVQRGRELYHTIGCVACHAADPGYEVAEVATDSVDKLLEQLDADEIEDMGLSAAARPVASVPLPNVAIKYNEKSLAYFLAKPHDVRPSSRMPDLKLLVTEAADIAAYLRSWHSVDSQSVASALPFITASQDADVIARGWQVYHQRGCVNCHGKLRPPPSMRGSVEESAVSLTAPSLASLRWDSPNSCVATVPPENRSSSVHYLTNASQADAMKAALDAFLEPSHPLDDSNLEPMRTMLRLNCYGCHVRDEHGGVGRKRKAYFETTGKVDLGDEGRLPPPLTGVGAKLRSGWFKQVFAGRGDIRSHMTIRMPIYASAEVASLATGFRRADRSTLKQAGALHHSTLGQAMKPSEAFLLPGHESEFLGKQLGQPKPVDTSKLNQDELASAGRTLMDSGCVQCHQFAGTSLPGVIGVDLSDIAKRTNPDWLRAFLLHPGSLKARTRMPTFFPDGKSQNAEVLSGNTELQLSAIWTYLEDVSGHGIPRKIEEAMARDTELKPIDRTIVLRTFMPIAGHHAIAVGNPKGAHFAYDSQRCNLAEVWSGRFLDAGGTWFSRFTPPAEPLSPESKPIAVGNLLQWKHTSSDSPSPRESTFLGYELDATGVPTFTLNVGGVSVVDRIEATDPTTLHRRLSVMITDDRPPVQWLRLHGGEKLTLVGPREVRDENGVTVRILSGTTSGASLNDRFELTEDQKQWRLRIDDLTMPEVELRYQWEAAQ